MFCDLLDTHNVVNVRREQRIQNLGGGERVYGTEVEMAVKPNLLSWGERERAHDIQSKSFDNVCVLKEKYGTP